MIKAVANNATTGRPVLILGITGENLTRLSAGEPISLALDADGMTLAPIDVVIFYGRDEAALVQQLAPKINNGTVIHGLRDPTDCPL